ncbi:MAG: hypothetical protein J3Q66DRAFT_409110 [Benniella sp.]|nr:MAG: hypothetical protein J3Q66DRAFT_409110 [Benniella sp.]
MSIDFCWIPNPAPLPFRLHNVPSLSRRSEGLRNLSSLTFRTALNSPRQLSFTEATNFCIIVGTILSQNPRIQYLEWGMGGELWAPDLVEHVLKRASKKLKKLSIVGYFIGDESPILEYLIDANDKQQCRQQQEQHSPREEKLNESDKPMECESVDDEKSSRIERDDGTDGDDDNGTDGGSGGCSELEELVLEAVDPMSIFQGPPELDWMWLNDVHGALPIRALTLLNFETDKLIEPDEYDEDCPAHQPNGSLMAILSKCPYLEKLCVTFDDPCHSVASAKYRFMREIRTDPHFVRFPCRLILVSEECDFVEKMYERCPRLREIEFGMAYQFTTDHWIEMMRSYGAQLESLSVWGNVSSFSSKAFMTMIGRPISHFTRDTPHRLTRLNISGMEHLHECAWMALYQLPQLKEFRARDVPLDARDLTMKDNWTCKGLEVLEIFVLVPKSSQWFWCDSCEEWAKDAMCCRKDVATAAAEDESEDGTEDESEDETEDDHENRNGDGQDSVTIATKRKRQGTGGTRETIKRARKESSEQTAEGGIEKGYTTLMDRNEDFARNQDDRDQSFQRYKQVQIRVCEMIGGLTELRELRIEGEKDFAFSNHKWDCLELTLETGLHYLRPLQQNLETLDVHTLHENLGGQKEVEWIARNWIHHNNPRWLEQHSSSTYATTSSASASSLGGGGGGSEQKGNALMSDNSDNFIAPYPKFRRLRGISDRVFDPIGSRRKNGGKDGDNDNDIDEFSQKRQDFLKNCRHIQSLCLTDARFECWLELIDELFFMMNPKTPVSLNPQAAGLKNLNPGIQGLEWKVDESLAEPAFMDIALRRMTRHLKKLSIVWRRSGTRLEFVLEHVMKAYEKRLEQLAHQELKEGKTAA